MKNLFVDKMYKWNNWKWTKGTKRLISYRTLDAILLKNLLSGKRVQAKIRGCGLIRSVNGVIWPGSRTIWVEQNFNAT